MLPLADDTAAFVEAAKQLPRAERITAAERILLNEGHVGIMWLSTDDVVQTLQDSAGWPEDAQHLMYEEVQDACKDASRDSYGRPDTKETMSVLEIAAALPGLLEELREGETRGFGEDVGDSLLEMTEANWSDEMYDWYKSAEKYLIALLLLAKLEKEK